MNRILTALLIYAFLLTSQANSQAVKSIGLKVGAISATQDWKYAQNVSSLDTKPRWGFDVGAFAEWFTLPVFSLTTELHYVQKGFSLKLPVTTEQFPDGNGAFMTLSPRVDYLSIPILAKCRLDWASSSLYAIAGPRIDFLVHHQDSGFGAVIDHFRSTEYGATIGIGYLLTQLVPFGLGAELRYSPTLQESYSTNLLAVRNSSFEMLILLTY